MTATGQKMTAEELWHLPDRGMRYELIAGELHEMPPAGGEHGFVTLEAAYRLRDFLQRHADIGGGLFAAETGFRLRRNPDTVRAPDVAYVAPERLPLARIRGYPELAPELRFRATSVSVTPTGADEGTVAMQGTLAIAGQERPVTINGTVARENGQLRVRGSKRITMTEWGVRPPSLMLGTMKVAPAATVGFDVILKP